MAHYFRLSIVLSVFVSSIIISVPNTEFGMRGEFGFAQGIGTNVAPEISVFSDTFLFYNPLRILFGFSALTFNESDLPDWITVHTLGLEHQFKNIIAGFAYNKSYIMADTSSYRGESGLSYHLGYKHLVKDNYHLIYTIGRRFQPLEKTSSSSPSVILESEMYFFRVGFEWYL